MIIVHIVYQSHVKRLVTGVHFACFFYWRNSVDVVIMNKLDRKSHCLVVPKVVLSAAAVIIKAIAVLLLSPMLLMLTQLLPFVIVDADNSGFVSK